MVKTKTKIILIIFIAAFILLASLGGAILYFYSHPAAAKEFIEKSMSRSTGSTFSIEKLSYSINPIRIHAEGILLDPGDKLSGLHLKVSDITAEICLEGKLGHKSLVFEKLKIDRFSFHVSQKIRLPELRPEPQSRSTVGRVFAKLIAFVLFRDIKFQQGEMTNGEAAIQLKDQDISLKGIHAHLTPDHLVEITCSTRIEWPDKQLTFTSPHIHITTDQAISLSDPEIKARLTAKNATLKSPEVNVKGVAMTANFTYNLPNKTLSFEPVDLKLEGVTLKQQNKKKSSTFDLYLETEGIFDLPKRQLNTPRFHLTIRDLLELTGRLNAHLHPLNPMGIEILIDEIGVYKKPSLAPEKRIEKLRPGNLMLKFGLEGEQFVVNIKGHETHLIRSALAFDMLPPGWQLSFLDSFELTAVQKQKDSWTLTSKLDFQGMKFQNEDATSAGEDVSVHVEAEGKLDPATLQIIGNAALKIDKGEILYDRFYMDVNKNPLSSSFKGSYNVSRKSMQISGLRLGLKDILALDISGIFVHREGGEKLQLSLHVPETSLKPAFRHFALDPFKTEKPLLKALKIDGKISAALDLTRNGKGWEVSGHCAWHDGKISMDDKGLSFEDIDLDLPIWYQSLKTEIPLNTIRGSLSISSVVLPYFPEQSITLNLDAGPNSMFVKLPTELKVPGGTATLGPVAGKDIFSPALSIDTSLAMTAVDIKPLVSKILRQPLQGTITGRLDPVHLEHNVLKTTGVIIARAFDGEIVLSDLGASGIFKSSPVYKLSALLTHLNLEKITTGTAFGKIEGILEGHINNIEIAYGQPQRFDLFLQTVPEEGVRQMISLKAVDNIAQIGGGTSPFRGLAGSFTVLFKEFPYNRIGVKASLENDVFRVNGTNRKGDKEYLVERGRFSGVNIVNQNPDNRIRFKDMVKRIKRVTAKGGGPVIK
jgi:hypothetical protein